MSDVSPYDPLVLLALASAALFLAAVFFAAIVFVIHFRNRRRALRWSALELSWQPQLLDLITGTADAPLPVAAGQRLHLVKYLVRVARALRGEERERLEWVSAPYLPGIRAQLSARRPEARARAVQSLATLGLPEHGDAIVAALDDESQLVAMTAARGLARRDTPQYAAAVLAHLDRFPQWDAGYLAALVTAIGPEAAPTLRVTLADASASPRVRGIAATALTALRDLDAAPIAAAVLRESRDAELLQAVLRLLAVAGGPEHVPQVRALALHPLAFVRAEAIDALGHVGAREDLDLLEAALEDESPWVALRAGHALLAARQAERLRQFADGSGARAIISREVLSERGA